MKYILLFSGILLPLLLQAQKENNYWAFGHNAGLNFNQNPPTVFPTELQSWEGGSVFFSDAYGNKLFYSNGNTVWDAGNNIMPNGTGLLGNGPASPGFPCSSAQGTVAAQSISDPDQYYLFTLDAVEDVPPSGMGKLRYSVIDMSLNGGMGDIVAGQKNIVLEDSLCEKMVLIPGDGCHYWLVVHHVAQPVYYAFRIDAGGIDPAPVTSTGILPGMMGIGMITVSPDTRRITLSHYLSGLEIAAFDKTTGMVSNASQFSATNLFGMSTHCFSADNTKLYLCRNYRLLQYDATLFPNINAMEASAVEIATSGNAPFGYMRRGPDDKIYIPAYTNPNLAVIHNPNDPGAACNYDLSGIALPTFAQFPNPVSPSNPYYGLGLGQPVLSIQNLVGPGPGSLKDTLVCAGAKLTFSVSTGRDHYVWNTGNTTHTITVSQPGTYWVHSWLGCRIYADTFVVHTIALNDWSLGNDTTICSDASLTLDAFDPAIDHYQWSDGSTASTYTATAAGSYMVKADVDGCSFSDTLNIAVYEPYVAIRQRDTTLCNDRTIKLEATAWPKSSYLWSNDVADSVLLVKAPGSYVVEATNICGTYTDSVKIDMIRCDCRSFIPNAFSPNGDGHNDLFELQLNCPRVEAFQLFIFNRYGQCIFQSDNPGRKWDGFFKGIPLDAGTYFYYLRYQGAGLETVEQKGDIVLIR